MKLIFLYNPQLQAKVYSPIEDTCSSIYSNHLNQRLLIYIQTTVTLQSMDNTLMKTCVHVIRGFFIFIKILFTCNYNTDILNLSY